MSDGALPTELQKFIARYIESVEKLEILLLLSSAPGKGWTGPEVYQQIQSSLVSVNQKLRDLCAEGLAHREGNDLFYFRPRTGEQGEQVAALKLAYQQRRIKVIESIFSKSTDELRKFADAFKLRKDQE